MKRVLYIVDGLGFGGTQRYVIDLAKFSSKFDVDPFVCSFVKGDQVKNELLNENIPILAVPVTKVYTSLKSRVKSLLRGAENWRLETGNHTGVNK